ncbi:BatD protein [Candidatus Magnetoovum chiemensis]|nr:BatD protein [Candidatus Magnetoovum chiemensis]
MKRTLLYLSVLLITIGTAATALCEDISFTISASKTNLQAGETAKLELAIEGTQNVSPIELPQIVGLTTRYIGPQRRMTIMQGNMSSSITHVYSLTPIKEGDYKIGPFSIEYNGKTYTSNEITITAGKTAKNNAQQQNSDVQGTDNELALLIIPEKTEVYLNEVIPVKIKLMISDVIVNDIEYPVINSEGISIGEFKKPRQSKEVYKGKAYDTVEFETTMFATKHDEALLGPATLKASVIVRTRRSNRMDPLFDDDFFNSFFNSQTSRPIELTSKAIHIKALPMPKEGQPENFKTAVGSFFNFDVKVNPSEVKVGDPVTLTMEITGEGNFNTLNAPEITNNGNFKIYDPQIKTQPNRKTIEQALLPQNDNIKEIPPISFTYFDPKQKQYKTITKGPFPLKVTKGQKQEQAQIFNANPAKSETQAKPKEQLGRDIIYIKDSIGNAAKTGSVLYKNPVFWIIQIIPLLIYITLLQVHKQRERLRYDVKYARTLKAPKIAKAGIKNAAKLLESNNSREFYNAIFKTLQEYLGNKLHLTAGGITFEMISSQLKEENISDDTINNCLKDLFQSCDMARYAQKGYDKTEMSKTLTNLENLIDYMEQKKL